jgi:hypothetical protein
MTWQLRSHDTVLGTTGAEMPAPAENMRSWPLVPTPEFGPIQPLVAAMDALFREPVWRIPHQISSIADVMERGRAIQSFLRSDPEARRRTDVYAKFNALELRLIDEKGSVLPTSSVGVTELPPGGGEVPDYMQAGLKDGGFESGPPYYLVVATLKPRAGSDDSELRRPG